MKSKSDRLLGQLEKDKTAKLPVHKKQEKDIQDDYEYSRDVYKDLINTGMQSLDSLAELARESEHPRAFEVLSRSIKDIADTTDKLMSLQKNKKDLETNKDEEAKTVTNNNMFIGSTTDLQRMLLANQEKEVIDHVDDEKQK